MQEVEKKTNTADSSQNYWFTVLLYFASFLIGLGIIAEIAANWQYIPKALKLSGALAAMALNAGVLIWTIERGKNVLKQVVACVYAFLIMGVIGLISQVFNLTGSINNACLLWALISWPLLWAAPRLLWLWLPLFLFGAHYMPPFLDEIMREVLGENSWSSMVVFGRSFDLWRCLVVLSVLLAYEAVALFGDKKNCSSIRKPLWLYSAILMLGLYSKSAAWAVAEWMGGRHFLQSMMVFNYSDFYVQRNIMFAVFILVAMGIWWLNRKKERVSFMPTFLVGAVAEYFVTCSLIFAGVLERYNRGLEMYMPGLFLFITFGYAYYHKFRSLLLLSAVLIIIWLFALFDEDLFDLLPCLAICALTAFAAYKKHSRRWFNVSVVAAVIRILIYYGSAADLRFLGMYLIGFGILIIVTILLLVKYNPVKEEVKDVKE